ncbi:MAG: MarR family winged helix-turn-helix transcriptional regulator [Rhodanobacter sp.]
MPNSRKPVTPPGKPTAPRTTASERAPLRLESFLPYRLSIVSNTVSQAIASDYQQRFDLSVTEWRVMAVLARFERISAREVAERTAMDKVAVSRAVARLMVAGRVHRSVHDNDKRRSVLRLSAAGWLIHDEVAPMARTRERALLAKLDTEERAWLTRILDKLLADDSQPAAPNPT